MKNKIIKFIERIFLKFKYLWIFYVAANKLFFKFNALYHGVKFNKTDSSSIHNFRRNIHRLEKGLSFKKLKDVFAEDYILQTVQYLAQSKKSNAFDTNTVDWGMAVLIKYFESTKRTPVIKKAYLLFQSLSEQGQYPKNVPYFENKRPALSVKYEDLYQLAIRRRSVRFYHEKSVEYSVVAKAMQVAALSPSACNRQSFKFLFYNEKKIVEALAKVPGGVTGYEVPSIIVIVGCYRGYFDERDVNAPIIDASLSAMAFLFAAETLGLSTVCINWPNSKVADRKIRQIIKLSKDEFIVMLMGVGYPDPEGKVPFSAKKPVSELLLDNHSINFTK